MISVVIPVYNAQNTIDRCVESVLRQSFKDAELILVDDGSTDNSPAMCDALAKQYSCVRVIHQPNGGVSSARNSGMASAQGEYVFFLDGDDTIGEGTLEAYAAATDGGRVDAIVGGMTVLENGNVSKTDGPPHDREFREDLWEYMARDVRMFGYAGGKMIRRAVVRDHGLLFDPSMSSQEDLDFFLSVYPHCETVRMMAFFGYQYDFVPSKRRPNIPDFIANQLKLRRLAQEKTALTTDAMRCVAERVAGLIYSGLADAAKEKQGVAAAQSYAAIEGLAACLREAPCKGERGRVIAWFLTQHYRRIERYFRWRQKIAAIVRRVRG